MSTTCIIYQQMNLKITAGTSRLIYSKRKKEKENSDLSFPRERWKPVWCRYSNTLGKCIACVFHTHASFTPIVSANLTLHFTHAPQSTASPPRYYQSTVFNVNQSNLAEREADEAGGDTSSARDSVAAQGFSVSCERRDGRLGHRHDQLELQRPDARKDGKLKEPRVKSEFTNVMPVLLHLLEITSQSGGSGTLPSKLDDNGS